MNARCICVWLTAMLHLAGGTFANAQCEPQWVGGPGLPGVNGNVYCLKSWDPDGGGPLDKVLVVGGSFSVCGNQTANNVAIFDTAANEWRRLGNYGSFLGSVTILALAVSPAGELVCGGSFFQMEGKPCGAVARWDGATWVPIGEGLGNRIVTSLVFAANGDLVAGCTNGVIARWNGAVWKTTAACNGAINALALLSDGRLAVGGEFTHAGGLAVNNIAVWDGQTWDRLGGGSPSGIGAGMNQQVRALAVLDSGELLAGGDFTQAGTIEALGIARLKDNSWQSVGKGSAQLASSGVWSILDLGKGSFAVVGSVTSKNSLNRVAAVWDGAAWSETKLYDPPFFSIMTSLALLADGRIAFGTSSFSTGTGFDMDGVFAWDRKNWFKLGSGLSSSSNVVLADGAGAFVGGAFTHADGIRVNGIAYWNGLGFSPLGTGVTGSIGQSAPAVQRIAVDPKTHDVVVIGQFQRAGDVDAPRIARWDGAAWHSVGNDPNATFSSIAFLPSGQLIAGGSIATSDGGQAVVARLDGSQWRSVGEGLTGGVGSLAVSESGRLLARGEFYLNGVRANLVLWNGVSWSAVGIGFDFNVDDAVFAGETMFATGRFNSRTMRRDGAAWTPIPSAPVYSSLIAAPAPQECFVAGSFVSTFGGKLALNIAHWQGGAWSAMGAGLSGSSGNLNVSRLNWADGNLYVSGNFFLADDKVSARLAHWDSNPSPSIVVAKAPVSVVAGSVLTSTAVGQRGLKAVSYQWQRESLPGTFVDVRNGNAGASDNGGTVSGASGQLPSPTDGTPATLTIANVQRSDAGMYRVTFWNACGEATSIPVEVKVKAHITDINADGRVDDEDFLLFAVQYDLMLCADPLMPESCSADFNHDGAVDDADFMVFIGAYNQMLF